MVSYLDATGGATNRPGIRAVIEHIAAELTVNGHHDAAAWLLSQLQAQVIPLRPLTEEPA
jgi:hypothetical protein